MNLGRHHGPDPVLITEAAPSLSEQHEARKRRYIATMALRAICLVLATVFYQTPVLLGVFAILAIVLPWIAVMVANDRPPKKALRTNRFHATSEVTPLPSTPAARAIATPRIINADD